ncbi:hypothetical protein [Streptomyces sp. NPDC056492]
MNGRKRHIAVDTLGLPVMTTVTAAEARCIQVPGPG